MYVCLCPLALVLLSSSLINMSVSSLDRVRYTQTNRFSLLQSPIQMFDANQTLRKKKRERGEKEKERRRPRRRLLRTNGRSRPHTHMYIDRKTSKMNALTLSDEHEYLF
jgi:hypothetical protein